LESVYRNDGGERPSETGSARQAVVLYVNMPTTFIVVTPFALLPWGPAHLLWVALTAVGLILAALLMWNLGESYAPDVSLFLICVLLVNSESLFAAGNTAGITISLCMVAVWCFIKERFVPAGILCMALSLAIKPHDVGLVWLYFLLVGGLLRKRALQAFLLTLVFGVSAIVWLSLVAPHWMQDWQSNLSTIAAHGGINEPGPASLTGRSVFMVIDLQAAVSVFKDDPRFYNPASYLVCGALLLAWLVRTLRSSYSPAKAWIALAGIVPLTMLVTYHRPWDAKLIMLTIPACAMLWFKGGPIGKIALLLNTLGIVLTADISLALLNMTFNALQVNSASFLGKILTLALIRPASLILLAMSVFYIWVYLRRTDPDRECGMAETISAEGRSTVKPE